LCNCNEIEKLEGVFVIVIKLN